MTNRERVLHRVLENVAIAAMTQEDLDEFFDGDHVEDLSQKRLRLLQEWIESSIQDRVREALARQGNNHRQILLEHRLALQLLWKCLGGGRSEKPPERLPESLDIELHPNIYGSMAELIRNIAARAFPVGQSDTVTEAWRKNFIASTPYKAMFSSIQSKVALAAHEKIRKLEEEAEERETALNQLQMTNATLSRKIAEAEQALKDSIRGFALDAIERIASKRGSES